MPRQIYFTGQVPGISPRLPMTPNIPPAVSGAGKGAASLGALADAGGKLLGAYMGYQERQQNCIVEDAWSEAQNKMREWRTEYQQSHKAGDAREAQAAFNSRWAQIADEINEKYGGELSDRHKHLLGRKMELGRIYADEDGAKYQEQQFNIWGRNQEAVQLARLQDDIETDPYNLARHDMAIQEAVSAWESRNPGQDSTAFALGLRDKSQDLILNALLASEDYDGAEEMIQKFADIAQARGQISGGMGGGTVSERNLAAHNYGNVKTKSGGFAAYASRQDGLMAIGERALRYSNAPDRGWHAQTLREMVDIYAPASDGNNPGKYAGFLAGKLGVKPDEKVNFHDPKILAGLIQSMPIMEHGARNVSISKEEAMQAAQALLAGKKPQSTGAVADAGASVESSAIPGRFAKYVKAIEAGRKRQGAEMRAQMDTALQDYFAACSDGKAGEMPFDEAQLRVAYGDRADHIRQRMEEAHSLNQDIRAMNDSDATSIADMIRAATPAGDTPGYAMKRGSLARRQEVARQILDARQKDPAGYLVQRSPQLQAAYGAMWQNPTPESVNAYLTGLQTDADMLGMANVPIFPKDQVSNIAGMIMDAPDPGAVLQGLQNAFGARWGSALQELSGKNGLPMPAKLAANDMPSQAAQLLIRGAREKDFVKKSLELNRENFVKTDFDAAVREAMEDFNATLLAGNDSDMASQVNDAVTILALQYANQGTDYKEAIKKAAGEVLLDRYSVRSVNGGKFRVPEKLDGDLLEKGAAFALKEISEKTQDLYTADYKHLGDRAASFYGKQLRAAGRWVTSADESGLILFCGGHAVLDKQGKPVFLAWSDLARHSDKAAQMDDQVSSALDEAQ